MEDATDLRSVEFIRKGSTPLCGNMIKQNIEDKINNYLISDKDCPNEYTHYFIYFEINCICNCTIWTIIGIDKPKIGEVILRNATGMIVITEY